MSPSKKCAVSIVFLVLSSVSASDNLAFRSSRLMVTFFTEDDNNITHFNFTGVKVVKQYGRRLLLDLNQPYNLDDQRNFWMLALKNVQMVEADDVASVTQGIYFPPWNLRNSEAFSVKVEDILGNPPDNGDVVVAILDSGIADLAKGKFLRFKNGYDFVSDVLISKDSDGRDADATDPGDAGPNCQSSWHGTAVASIIASKHDGPVVRGIAPYCTLLSVRVSGQCGNAYYSDIADAIVWSAGGRIDGVSDTSYRAKIINLSLGSLTTCPSYLQSAINQAVGLGVLVVVAAGNDAVHVSQFSPANCANVVSVAASARDGSLTSYSNWGATVSAPGGSSRRGDLGIAVWYIDVVWGVLNQVMIGTSFASPHVAALASLIEHNAVDTIQKKFYQYLSRRLNPYYTQVPVCRSDKCAGEFIDWPKLSSPMNYMNCTGFGLRTCYDTGQNNMCTYGCMCGAGLTYSIVQSAQAITEGCVQCPSGTFSLFHGFRAECSACESCQAGKYRIECGSTSSGRCVDCDLCPRGKYRKDCGGVSPGVCADCNLQCSSSQYISTECGGTSPGVCSPCTFSPQCQYDLPGQCILPFSPCTPCPTCQSGKYRTRACENRVFGSCLSCPSCPDGQYRKECRDFSIGTCASCQSCQSGYYRVGCEYLSPGECNPCGSCPSGQFRIGCSNSFPGECISCQNCSSGQWLDSCTGSNPGTCIPCTNLYV